MRIGIITYHRAKNYGAVLQAYALQETLLKKHDVEIVDYRSPYIERSYYVFKQGIMATIKRHVKCVLRRKDTFPLVIKDFRFFSFSRSFLRLSKKYSPKTISYANNRYDCFISGSDQIWNMKWSDNDNNYLLAFAEDKKKYSYAASLGDSIEPVFIPTLRGALSSYQSIIVREKKSVSMLKELGICDRAQSGCDPVFFLKRQEWIDRFSLSIKSSDYILLYIIAKDDYSVDFARKTSQKLGLKVYYLNLVGIDSVPSDLIDIKDAGPKEFLQYILNAALVITTSFHGLAFSLIFHTPFYFELTKMNDNANIRIQNLIEIFDISDRQLINTSPPDNTIDWNRIDQRIEDYSFESHNLLYSSLLQ